MGAPSFGYSRRVGDGSCFERLRRCHCHRTEHPSPTLAAQEWGTRTLLDLIEDIILPNPKPGVRPPKYNIRIPFGKTRRDTNIEDIFYDWFRCNFVHEGTFTPDASLTPRTERGDELHLTQPTGIPEAWIPNLLVALSKTPELA